MELRVFILSLIFTIFLSTTYADSKQQPIFESNSMWEAINYTGVKVEKNVAIKTENYVHYLSYITNHAVIFHKTKTMLFIRMGNTNVRAYFLFGMTMDSGNKWWSVYEILIKDKFQIALGILEKYFGGRTDLIETAIKSAYQKMKQTQ